MPSRLCTSLALALALTATAAAQEPKLPDARTFDKLVSDALRDVHDKGATIYNDEKDFAGTFRLYQGALATVRPLLAHRPEAQQLIDTGFAAADKVPDAEGKPDFARKAFLLHETIEAVRKELKAGFTAPKPSEKKPVEKKPEDKKPVDPPKKPEEKKQPTAPTGTVTVQGKPLALGNIVFVTQGERLPRTFNTTVVNGKYRFLDGEQWPAGKYVVIVTGADVPEKYTLTTTSGLTLTLGSGPAQFDIELK